MFENSEIHCMLTTADTVSHSKPNGGCLMSKHVGTLYCCAGAIRRELIYDFSVSGYYNYQVF